jgi:16S rRNA (uracil1498-N3)-methyltransferase
MIKLDKKQLDKKMQHWSNIMISAAQQCGRTYLPILNAPLSLEKFLSTPFMGANVGFDLSATTSLKSIKPTPHAIRLLIGPESGFDEQEIKLATKYQFEFYTLGPRVLRAETASIAALSALQLLYGDL